MRKFTFKIAINNVDAFLSSSVDHLSDVYILKMGGSNQLLSNPNDIYNYT